MSFFPRMLLWSTLLLSGIFGHVDARPQNEPSSLSVRENAGGRDNSTRPCGYIFDEVGRFLDDGLYPVFGAGEVYACLIAVPFVPDVALRFIDYYNTTLQFQSTLAYLRYPTAEYQQPAIDVIAELGRVKQKVLANQYQRQLDFEYDIHSIVLAMHDNHVSLSFGITAPFIFASSVDIVSASLDGKALPQPYLKQDIIQARDEGWAWQPSPIVSINGVEAIDYLTRFAKQHSFGNLEDHADWNDLFEHPANDVQGFYGTWGGNVLFYPGVGVEDDGIRLKLANNTEVNDGQWLAFLNMLVRPGPLETAGDFYNYFVLGLEPPSADDEEEDDDSEGGDHGFFDISPVIPTPDRDLWAYESEDAYPAADIAQENLAVTAGGVVTAYFHEDVGILSLPSFQQFPEEAKNYSATVQKFITQAEKKNTKKIIIDVQQNRGGSVGLAFDTFRRFFPEEPSNLPWTWAGSRRRSHPLGDDMGTEMTEWYNKLPEDDFDIWAEAANEFVISTRINALTNKTFANWGEYSPSPTSNYRGDHWSNVERYNLFSDEFLYSAFSSEAAEDDPYGFGLNPIVTKQIWKADEIVILTDGLCSSACSMFVNMMTQAGVRTVVAGGRPETGPMQAVAGSRGSRAYSANILDFIMKFLKQDLESKSTLIPTIPQDFDTRDSGIWVQNAAFNLRDEILKPDFDADPNDQHLPRQFQYEAAHCRIFYTVKSIYNMTQLWSDVAKAAWTNPALCVAGSTGYADLPNQPATSLPPPRLPIHQTGVVNTTRGSSDGDNQSFNEGDIVAGIKRKTEAIKICGKNNACAGDFECRKVRVANKCGAGAKPKAEFIGYCLPPCSVSASADSAASCGQYVADSKGFSGLSCRAKTSIEAKGRSQVIGCCTPSFVRAVSSDLCVKIAPTNATST
ncbi:hypothetical protein QBC43DRAFT_326278 [Cladorrhinum sp. PSN259]|nr:hypothetical protein QBC43DRAFT_326278 [Cladorrhinum sp. PSN259]